jgi:hypothetical protein
VGKELVPFNAEDLNRCGIGFEAYARPIHKEHALRLE